MLRQICPQTSVFCHNQYCPTRPLLLPMPRMWAPIDCNRHCRPSLGNHLAQNMMTSHPNNCYQTSHQNIKDLGHNCCGNETPGNDPSVESQTDIIPEFGDSLNAKKEELESVSIVEVNDECDAELDKNCVHLKAIIEILKQNLFETTQKLKESQLSVIKLNEKLCLNFIENYEKELQKCCDYTKLECIRFYGNDSMAAKLEPIVEQISGAKIKAKEAKEKIRTKFSPQNIMIGEDFNPNYNLFIFDSKSLPQFPDVIAFYKNIIDEIPVQFFDDFNLIKSSAKEYVNWKLNIESNIMNEESVKSDQQLIDIPVVSNKPQLNPNESHLDVIPLPSTSIDTTHSFKTNANVNQIDEIVTRFYKESESNDSISQSQSSISSSIQKQILNMKESLISEEISYKELKAKEEQKPNEEQTQKDELKHKEELKREEKVISSPSEVSKLSEWETKLLNKLKDKYKDLSEQILIESMVKTRESVMICGNQKGFSGMKMSEIIKRISDYIDNEVLSTQIITIETNSKELYKTSRELNKNCDKRAIRSQNISIGDKQKSKKCCYCS